MSIVAVIPARYGSTRFPGKLLADLCGKPLIAHTIERAREAALVDDVLVATDDERIAQAALACGARGVMTSPDCASGTDRIAQAIAALPEAEIVVNVQGDEPLMAPETIDATIVALRDDPDCAVATAMIRILSEADYRDAHVVKALPAPDGRALYFSRSPVPSNAHWRSRESVLATLGGGRAFFWGFKHFGLYVYRREALLRFVELAPSPLEIAENLEQLRFLENGMRIRIIETEHDSIGVDTPEDLEAAQREMRERGMA